MNTRLLCSITFKILFFILPLLFTGASSLYSQDTPDTTNPVIQKSSTNSIIEGIVKSEKDVPIGNIFVEIESSSGEAEGEYISEGIYTSEDGTFSFEGIEAGTYKVTVENPDTYFMKSATWL